MRKAVEWRRVSKCLESELSDSVDLVRREIRRLRCAVRKKGESSLRRDFRSGESLSIIKWNSLSILIFSLSSVSK